MKNHLNRRMNVLMVSPQYVLAGHLQAICGAFYALVGVWDVPDQLEALNRLPWPSVAYPWTVVALVWAG